MAHGILQFTPSIAFRYVLHRCESLDIRCRESCKLDVPLSRRTTALSKPHTPLSKWGCSLARNAPNVVPSARPARRASRRRPGHPRRTAVAAPRPQVLYEFAIVRSGLDNDPSAGSPTETLLRLLLPLNDKVQRTSRDVTGSEPPPSPRSEHFTGPFNR